MNDDNENQVESKNNNVRERRRALLKEFSSNVTLHGFHFIVEEKRTRRAFWIIITTICAVLAVILFSDITTEYFSHKALTVFVRDGHPVQTPFPSVTICNLNPMSHKKITKNKPEDMTNMELYSFYRNTNPLYSATGLNWSDPMAIAFLEKLKLLNVTTMSDFKRMSENDLGTYLGVEGYRKCSFDEVMCNESSFTVSSTWLFSSCFTFNPYQQNKASITSKRSGLFSNLILWGTLYMQDVLYQANWPVQGMTVFIHPYGTPGVLSAYTQKIMIPAEMFANIEISPTKVELLPPPYKTKCGERKFKIVTGYNYSKEMCVVDCILAQVYNECGCVGFDVQTFVGNASICTIQQHRCYLEKRRENLRLNRIHRICDCPKECVYFEYTIKYSSVHLVSREEYEYVKAKENDTYSSQGFYTDEKYVGIHVYLRDLVVNTEKIVPAVLWSGLLGAIGGNVGLCLGFSMITLFEFIFFFYDCIAIRWRRSNE